MVGAKNDCGPQGAMGILQRPVGLVTGLCARTANNRTVGRTIRGAGYCTERYRISLEILRNSGSSTNTIWIVGTLLKRDSELTCV